MFKKLLNKIQYRAERFIVWTLQRVLRNYSRAVSNHIDRIDAEAVKFRSEVVTVAEDHHERIRFLERAILERKGTV